MDPIVAVSAGYRVRQYRTELLAIGWQQICPANPSRWALRVCAQEFVAGWISPFPGQTTTKGIKFDAGDDWHTYLSRDPVLTGLAWYFFQTLVPVPSAWIEVWDTSPVGT